MDELKKVKVLLWAVLALQIVLLLAFADLRIKFTKSFSDQYQASLSEYQKKVADWQKDMETWQKATELRDNH